MKRSNTLAVGGYLLAAVGTIALAQWLRHRGVPLRYTRKLVHGVAGLSPLYVVGVAETKWPGVACYALTIAANMVFWKRRLFGGMSGPDDTPGIVYFPIVQTGLLAWLWNPHKKPSRLPVAIAALLTLALGDAAAALVGQEWGKHRYHFWGSQKSWEGSAAMLAVSTGAIAVTLKAASVPEWKEGALLAGVTAAGIEAIAPHGLDNLAVPLAVAMVLLAVLE